MAVMRRAATAAVNWSRRSVYGANSGVSSFCLQEIVPRLRSVVGFTHLNALDVKRNFWSSSSLGSAVLDESSNNVGAGNGSGYNAATGTYYSQFPPLRLPDEPSLDINTFIFDGKSKIGDRAALIDGKSGKKLTYSELEHAISSLELGLISIGVQQGDVVMVVSSNSIYYPAIFLGVTSVGGVIATLNPLSTAEETKNHVAVTQPRFIVVEEALVDKVAGLGLPLIVMGTEGKSLKHLGATVTPISDLLASDPESHCAPEIGILQEDSAAILQSSGTMGVILSHKNILAQILQLAMLDEEPQLFGAGTHLCGLPMCHAFGSIVITLQQLYRGATIVVTPNFDDNQAIAHMIRQHQITHLYAVPSIITKIMTTFSSSSSSSSSSSFDSVHRIISTSASFPKEQLQACSTHFPRSSFLEIYGMSEVGGALAANYLKENASSSSSASLMMGSLLSGIEAKVVNGNGETVGPNCQGELLVRGPNIMKGYASGRGSGLDKEGWLSTGDVVSFDNKGKVYVIDRIKEVANFKASQGK